MASYTVGPGEWGAYEKTLAAATVDTVTFTGRDVRTVEITNHDGTAPIYATTDGVTAPTDKGASSRWMIPPGQSAQFPPKSSAPTVVKVISRATATYSVGDVTH